MNFVNMPIAKRNEAIQQALARLVVEEITGQPFDKVNATFGPLMTNYFSFVFTVQVMNGQKPYKVFVKIPKEDLRCGPKEILPVTYADRTMAEGEVNSLQTLAANWSSEDAGVSWVRLRGFIPEYNAIVTDAVDATDALDKFRQMDLRRRAGYRADAPRLRGLMARLGDSLGLFHKRSVQDMVFRLDEALPKFDRYCRELAKVVRGSMPEHVMGTLRCMAGFEIGALQVPTLKGIDIRNVLMDGKDSLFLLDPGPIKRTCREADLARFIMTYRILYWGSKLFLLGLRPDKQAEEAFLKAYYAHTAPPDQKLLSLYLIKEYLKHWYTAIQSLELRPWPNPLKPMVAAIYFNRYYSRQLAAELHNLA